MAEHQGFDWAIMENKIKIEGRSSEWGGYNLTMLRHGNGAWCKSLGNVRCGKWKWVKNQEAVCCKKGSGLHLLCCSLHGSPNYRGPETSTWLQRLTH